MPGVLIEAGIAGLPAVAFNVGGIGEVISDGLTGLLAPAGDVAGLTAGVVRLAKDRALRSSMGTAASTRCGSLFDMRKVASQYEQLLLSLLAGERRNRPAPESRQAG